jgi:hypothetical protein
LPDREVERIALWMAEALVEATQRDAERQAARRLPETPPARRKKVA